MARRGLGCGSCGGTCKDAEPLGMGYLRGLGAYGLGQDDGSDDDGGDDGSGDDGSGSTSTTPVLGASDCAYGGTYPNCNPAPAASSSSSGDGTASAVQSFCASQGETYNSSTNLCNVPASGGVQYSPTSAASIASDISQLLAGGVKIAQIATGTTGSVTLTSNELLIGAAILAAIFIIPAALSKK